MVIKADRVSRGVNHRKKSGLNAGVCLLLQGLLVLGVLLPARARQAEIKTVSPENDALQQARSLLRQGKVDEAEHIVRQYANSQPESAEAHYLLGFILFRAIQGHAALEGASEGAQYNELDPGLAEFAKKRAEESLAEYTAGARYSKPSAADLKIVALDYIVLGDFPDADKWLTRSLEWNPQDAEGWYQLGRTKYNENRFQEAIEAFERCLKLEPKNLKAEDNLGLAYEGLGRVDQAIAAYQKAIEWESESGTAETPTGASAGPYLDLGSLLLDQNRPQDALAHLQRAAEIAPREARVHEKLGKAYAEVNQLPEAQKELEEAVKLSPKNGRLHFMLGQVYRKQGLTEKAKAEMQLSGTLDGVRSIQ